MAGFDARAEYNARRDVRDHKDLVALLRSPPQRSVIYPLIGARRAGKTWTLRALELLITGNKSTIAAKYLDLRQLGANLPQAPQARCLLLDEPEITGNSSRTRNARELLRWCQGLRDQGATILLAMSPAEWVTLHDAGEAEGLVSAQDLRFLRPLTATQGKKIARTDAAKAILAKLPDAWRKSPFLLELTFQVAEEVDYPAGEDVRELLRLSRERSEDAEFFYFEAVFRNGLTDAQREALRNVARGLPADPREIDLLERSNLVGKEGPRPAVGDPILAANLCPLRIHHLSDIHFGDRSAQRVDVKERGAHGEVLRGGLGPPRVCDQYVSHVRELVASGRGPHVIVISGDIAERATEGEYREARAWLDGLLPLLAEHPRLRPEDPQVLLTGGNHDVDWPKTLDPRAPRERHRAFVNAFAALPRSRCTHLDEPPEARSLAVARYADLGVEIVLLGSSEFGGEVEKDPAREELLAFIDGLRRRALDAVDEEKAEALRAKVSRIDPGLVHDRDLAQVRQAAWHQPIRIAALHHPVSPLPFTELARFAALVNAGEVKDALVQTRFCLVLHGHAHMGWFGKEQWPERHEDWTLRIAAAPSLGSREVLEHNGYNEVEIAREPAEGDVRYEIHVHRVVREGATWVRRTSMGPFAPGA